MVNNGVGKRIDRVDSPLKRARRADELHESTGKLAQHSVSIASRKRAKSFQEVANESRPYSGVFKDADKLNQARSSQAYLVIHTEIGRLKERADSIREQIMRLEGISKPSKTDFEQLRSLTDEVFGLLGRVQMLLNQASALTPGRKY